MFDVDAIRAQFPILQREIEGKPLVYLDNAATTQKPQCVIDALTHYYTEYNSNVHRGAHKLADEATCAYEQARNTIADFINAPHHHELIWTAGTTEALNIIAKGLTQQLTAGDEIIVSEMEHHANLVPWQQAALHSGAKLIIAPINDQGELRVDVFTELLNERTKMVSIAHISNTLGTINPIKELVKLTRQHAPNALFSVDGAQGVAHGDVDVQDLDCDFYSFSGHKVFGPTGVGCLWGKTEHLASWPVWQTGGEMIKSVSYQSAEWNTLPGRLEAGTPNIAGAIGLGAAISWLAQLDLSAMRAHEQSLIDYATRCAEQFDGVRIIGTAANKIGVLSFMIEGAHPADIGFLLDKQAVAIRTGSHCAEPLMDRLGVPATARASFSIYNTRDDIDEFFKSLRKVQMMLA